MPLRIAAILATMLLASCFDVREELWIESDGSGRLRADYTLPGRALDLAGGPGGLLREIEAFIASQPDLNLADLEITRTGGDAHVRAEITTDSMLSLLDLQESESVRDMPGIARKAAGEFDVEVSGLEIDFRRRIDLGPALGFAAVAIGGSERRSRELVHIIHLPTPAKTHNATRTENGGRTLIWRHSLGEALENPVDLRFRADIPLPWWLIPAVTALGLLVLALIVRRWRRRSPRLREC